MTARFFARRTGSSALSFPGLNRLNSFVFKLFRYSVAIAGPIASAGAQFAQSLTLIRLLDAPSFGAFSFLLIASQFSWGISSALFCAPLPIVMTTTASESKASALRGLYMSNLTCAALAWPLFLALGRALHISWPAAILLGAYATVALIRWFARAYAYATGNPLRTMYSDIVYSLILLAGVIVASFVQRHVLDIAFASLLLGSIAGLTTFDRPYFIDQFIRIKPTALVEFGSIWKKYSRWALLGVLTTEATANSHVYIVTVFYGSAAFAPIAASSLMIRPINVAMNALTEFERASMARRIGEGHIRMAMASVRFFRFILILTWMATALSTIALLHYSPGLIFPTRYKFSFLAIGAVLWMAVAGVRLLRTPDSALLQAAGAFRSLAFASVISSGVSILGVIALLLASGPLWSIAGILFGETVFAGWIWRQARQWRLNAMDKYEQAAIVDLNSGHER